MDKDMTSVFVPDLTEMIKHQRSEGLQLISGLFSWSEFTGELRQFHQEFVYDITMFAANHGLPWSDVARTALAAKTIFPHLDGVDAAGLLSLLKSALLQCLPNLSAVQQHEFTRFLTETCVSHHKLFQAVVGGAGNIITVELQVELQLPPTPQPLVQGTEQEEWERQVQLSQVMSAVRTKEEKLRALREGSRVTVRVERLPEYTNLDKEEAEQLVRAAVKATQKQMKKSLDEEMSLLSGIMKLMVQKAALTNRGRQASADSKAAHPEKSPKPKGKKSGKR